MDQDVTDRFSSHDARFAALETRVTAAEVGAAKMESAMIELTKKVDSLTATQKLQLEILQRLDAVAANPNVKVILAIAATVMASWWASKGLGK